MAWKESDLVNEMVKLNFKGFECKKSFYSVISGCNWYTVSFLTDGQNNKIVFSHRICKVNCFQHTIDFVYDVPTEVGNTYYKQLAATKATSKNKSIYYKDPNPKSSALKNYLIDKAAEGFNFK